MTFPLCTVQIELLQSFPNKAKLRPGRSSSWYKTQLPTCLMAIAAGDVCDLFFSASHLFPHTNKMRNNKNPKLTPHNCCFKLLLSYQSCQLSFHEPLRNMGFTCNDCKVIVAYAITTSFNLLGFFSGHSLDFGIDSVRKSLVDLSGKADLPALKVRVCYSLFCTNTAG